MLFITQPRVGTSHNEIIALHYAAQEHGFQVYPSEMSWRLESDLIDSKLSGIPYGSQLFCETIAQQMNWKLLQNSFDWLAKLPQKFLKRKVDFMTLSEAKKLSERKFIKPADDKCFDAKIYEPGNFTPSDFISSDYPVLVSDVVSWDLEYRCFIKDSQVCTWSNYMFFGEPNNPKYHYLIPGFGGRPEEFIYSLFSEIDEVPNCVIDIGIIHDKGWAVIETNPIWASGIYGCDPYQIVSAMKDSVVNKNI